MKKKHIGLPLLALALSAPLVALAERGRPDFESLDSDGDGAVTLAEFEAGAPTPPTLAEIFDRLDADGDGLLSESEMQRGHGGRHGPRGPRFMDEDQDGLISQEEFLSNAPDRARDPSALFERIDANADGYLDSDELASARPRR